MHSGKKNFCILEKDEYGKHSDCSVYTELCTQPGLQRDGRDGISLQETLCLIGETYQQEDCMGLTDFYRAMSLRR